MIDLTRIRPLTRREAVRPIDDAADDRIAVWPLLATIALTGLGMLLIVLGVATLAPVALG
ncbi:MAG TPA: hypothetical protein VFQ80_07955 [Thermomicrobiales bacterium]|nr:hypothetical protein [Thermomicrobiales bacterium]